MVNRPAFQVGLLAICGLLPLIFAVGHADVYLADPMSELPVKIWGFETFGSVDRFLGGVVDTIGHPQSGPLNNPDMVGTLITGIFRPLVGRAWAYNLLVCLLLVANTLSAWALARLVCGRGSAAMVAGVAFGLTPLVLVYGVSSAITDLLNLWPYPLGIMLAFRAFQDEGTGLWGGWKPGIGAGILLGLGFVTCVYNFVVFAPMVVPFVIWLPHAWERGMLPGMEGRTDGARPALKRWGRVLLHTGLGFGVLGGAYAAFLLGIMNDPNSLMSSEMVQSVRHEPPFFRLSPDAPDRYTAYFMDYLAVGKSALISRDNAARFYRAFSPGWLVLGLMGLGLWHHRKRMVTVVFWPFCALVLLILSTGPFLPVTHEITFHTPMNLLWVGFFHFFPGTKMLLEPFRYALVVAMCVSVGAAVGARVLVDRFGDWVGPALVGGVLLELVLVSPVPVPMATARLETPAIYSQLADVAPEGAVIELPYFDRGSARFVRMHFFHQLTHGRSIADQVFGHPPLYLVENPFIHALLVDEELPPQYPLGLIGPEHSLGEGRERLAADGFSVLMVDPARFKDDEVRERVRERIRLVLGSPLERDGRWVYPLK